jgi:CRISPR-associated protein Csb1
MPLSYSALVQAVADDSAFRRRRRLQPVGGPGDKLYPPTYPGEGKSPPRHVFERRRVDGREAWCVLIDSVQSQANRLEEALLEAARAGHIPLPRLSVDFAVAGLNSIGEITTLDAPHRVFDAILRDSLLDGMPFSKSPLGDRLRKATDKDATAILEASPSALLFGVWNSTGAGGGLGAKFPRAIVSEIIGVDVPVEDAPADTRTGEVEVRTAGRRTGSASIRLES